jgi:hypothetical protein
MVAKQVQFGHRPVRQPTPEELDQFVHKVGEGAPQSNPSPAVPSERQPPAQIDPLPPEAAAAVVKPAKPPMKRLTFDVPADLHRRMRLACVMEGRDMAEVIRDMLMQRFPPDRRS